MRGKTSKLTPMMEQYFNIKEKYKDYILFYRLGDFYEMFYEDAVVASKVLDITLTKRGAGKNDAPLCGVPHHSADSYIAKMVKNGYKVAICEQVEDPKKAKGIVKRDVVRLITPGTLSDLEMLDATSNTYLASIFIEVFQEKKDLEQKSLLELVEFDKEELKNLNHNLKVEKISLAYTDVSTGIMYITSLRDYKNLYDELYRIKPAEIIISPSKLKGNYNSDDLNNTRLEEAMKIIDDVDLCNFLEFSMSLNSRITWKDTSYFSIESSKNRIKRIFKLHNLNSLSISKDNSLIKASGGLFAYIEETQKMNLTHFHKIIYEDNSKMMLLDNFTRNNLELTSSLRKSETKGTLFWVLNDTKSAMGARLLKEWIEKPLLSIDEIRDRHKNVEIYYNMPIVRSNINKHISTIYDFERIITKVVFKTANPKDINALKISIESLNSIQNILKDLDNKEVKVYLSDFDNLLDAYNLINDSIKDDAPFLIREGKIFKNGYNEYLDELWDISTNASSKLQKIEEEQREITGIKNLKIGFNKVFGYYIEVSKSNINNVPESYIRKQTLANAERYIIPELKDLEEKILNAHEKIKALEYDLYIEFRDSLLLYVQRIRHMAYKISYLDVIISFANVAENNRYTKAVMNEESNFEVIEGRHPVVEHISTDEDFISNDINLDNKSEDSNFFMIVTGPNMAGKSTYLRQNALIALMAQIGSFVPAKYANLSIVDRIFTRVGASDDLFNAQSTFMVEMNELASILNNATSKSLIILDEIGRGTSTYDGLSIAWAVVEYIAMNLKSKTIFATHYHELTELEDKVKGVENYYISVIQKNDEIAFLRKIKRGGANQSLGIQVAKLAGINESIITRAKELLLRLETSDIVKNSRILSKNILENKDNISVLEIDNMTDKLYYEEEFNLLKKQINKNNEIIQNFKSIDINNITPFEALQILNELKIKIGE